MNITTKRIITDTNIITDLSNANILDKFVMLDNAYINDMVKSDEINFNTGNESIIEYMKVIEATPKQIAEIVQISQKINGLSPYDIVNYIIARDNNAILATGDRKLKNFAESNGIEVIRTLKIIRLLHLNKIISNEEAINACKLLRDNSCTRIPKEEIDKLMENFKNNSIFS